MLFIMVSLVSVLTAERSFALLWPNRTVPKHQKIFLRIVTAVMVICISLTRARYIFNRPLIRQYLSTGVLSLWSTVKIPVRTFSDAVLPFVLAVLMACFSGMTLLAVIKRRRFHNKIGIARYPGPKTEGRSGGMAQMSQVETIDHKKQPMACFTVEPSTAA